MMDIPVKTIDFSKLASTLNSRKSLEIGRIKSILTKPLESTFSLKPTSVDGNF
jgi:hypothetical protein